MPLSEVRAFEKAYPHFYAQTATVFCFHPPWFRNPIIRSIQTEKTPVGIPSMHGLLRFLLAILVVLSHLNHEFGAIHAGVPAVAIFYMLAGYVVTNLLHKHFSSGPGRLCAFYKERCLRIYPLYLTMLLLTTTFLFSTGFGRPVLSATNVFGNLTIIPLNYYMFADFTVAKDMHFWVLPPSWSLGAEIQVYAILPLILKSQTAKWFVGMTSLGVFTFAAAGFIDPNIWGYRLLPGIFFIFLTGSSICKTLKCENLSDLFDRSFAPIAWTWLLFLLLALTMTNHPLTRTTEVMLGFLFGVPILSYTSKIRLRASIDSALGQLSYGLFLAHSPALWLFMYLHPGSPIESGWAFIFVLSVALTISAIIILTVERIAWPFRKGLTVTRGLAANTNATKAA